MGLGKKWFLWSQVVIGMLLVQAFATGMQILSRIILVEGTFVFALMTYRHLVAALCVAPLAFYFERVSEVNKCNKNVWFWLFCNALAGITGAMGLFYYGLRNTTATYATNFLNLVPIVTFVLSILLKLERLNLHTKEGKVKCIGALMCVSGALITSLYKGKSYYIISHHHTTNHSHTIPHTTHTNWPLGTLMLVGSCFSCSAWFLIQVKLKRIFPYRYWAILLTCLIGAVQSAIIGLCIDTSVGSWTLGWNLQLITIIYSGSLATAATFCLVTWAISLKGATYPSMFNPLTLIFVSLSEAIILGVSITTGTLIGMMLIIFGLYSFLLGNKKENKSLVHDENNLEGEGATKMLIKNNNNNNNVTINHHIIPTGLELTTINVVPTTSPKQIIQQK
ncbi:WAT1-related protein At1g09380 [Cannabis sativa]|uniref:WAT1-related protein At1g09380 n=1 Tax=Cannabis sativa TaxID=3483 RepID=UPI0029CA7188|nr:WAT1-related protein At1g09380 [Cannabis sativa]